MKKLILAATVFLFSCASEIESPDSILQRISSSSEIESSSSEEQSSNSGEVSSSSVVSSSSSTGGSSSSTTLATDPPLANSGNGPVSYYGKLKANGNKLIGSKTGTTAVQVRGVSLGWSNTGWESAAFFNAAAVNAMVDSWKAEIIRVPIGYAEGGGYKTDASNLARVKTAINAAIAKDVYVIIDWHSHNAHNELAAATAFFEEMAKTYGANNHVIFEIYNEPLNIAWSTIKTYANSIISAIRQYSDNLILVGTPNWDQNVNVAASSPVSDSKSNIAYVFHFYAYTHTLASFQSNINTVLSAGYPVFVSEYGTTHADGGDGANYNTHSTTNSDAWHTYMDNNKISNVAWNVNDKYEGSAFFGTSSTTRFNMSSWTSTSSMTASGQYIYNKLNAYANSAAWRGGGLPAGSSSSGSSTGGEGYQVLTNGDFNTGSISPWVKSFGSLSSLYQGSITLKNNAPYGYDAIFEPSGNEYYDYDLQLLQRSLNIKPGYSYKLEFGGNVLDGGYYGDNTANVVFALLDCPTTSDCTSYKDWNATLTADYADYTTTGWKNCSVTNSNATFVISGGNSYYDFKIAWVSVSAEPVSCP